MRLTGGFEPFEGQEKDCRDRLGSDFSVPCHIDVTRIYRMTRRLLILRLASVDRMHK